MGGRATVVASEVKAEGSAFVNSMPVRGHPRRGRQRRRGPGGARRAGPRTASSTSTTRRSRRPPTQSTIAVVGLGQPRARVLHRLRPPADARGARGDAPGPHREAVRAPGRRAADGPLGDAAARSCSAPTASRYLDEDAIEGEDPRCCSGRTPSDSLRREDAMLHAPDILLLSQYDPELGEVAAFEELIGSHGGLGGFADPAVHPPSRPSGSSTSRCRSAPPRSTATSGAGWLHRHRPRDASPVAEPTLAPAAVVPDSIAAANVGPAD